MVFHYNYQPNTGPMDPAAFRIHVASGIIMTGNSSGELVNVLGSTGVESIPPDPLTGDATSWLLFDFPNTVNLTPGDEYYLRVEHVGGYDVDSTGVGVAIGSLGSTTYSPGKRWGSIYNQFLDRWEQFAYRNEDLVFSLGSKVAVLPGDFNLDGAVDAADYTVWRDGVGSLYSTEDYDVWKANFGETLVTGAAAEAYALVPEPVSLGRAITATAGLCHRRRRPA